MEDMYVTYYGKLLYRCLLTGAPRYVDFNFAQDTAAKIKNTEQYITNQLFHNGLTRDSKDVMKRLFDLSKRVYD